MRTSKERLVYNEYIYRIWHFVQNVFAEMNRRRRIGTRYAKNAVSHPAAVHIQCIIM
jgi:hypothetical protein